MTKLHERMLPDVRMEPATARISGGRASDKAAAPGDAVEYSSYFISVMNLDMYVRCFDSLMSRSPTSRGPNFYVYMNHNRT